jgi:hypothetical protein
MARQVLPVAVTVKNVWLDVAALPLVPVPADGCIVDAGVSEHVMLIATQTNGAAHTLTVKSQYGTADDLIVTMGATTGFELILLETMKYEILSGTDRGKIYVDFETGYVGKIFAVATLK